MLTSACAAVQRVTRTTRICRNDKQKLCSERVRAGLHACFREGNRRAASLAVGREVCTHAVGTMERRCTLCRALQTSVSPAPSP